MKTMGNGKDDLKTRGWLIRGDHKDKDDYICFDNSFSVAFLIILHRSNESLNILRV